ncbi:hypothetical protein AB1Y20_017239 [Prymnesium parvum]|uniref:Transmembrane 9 superfamily member n=1 Tax=Prymnesium parvum TaxID=97485 RepID=A0AB34I9H8_PRYPA
MLLSPLSGPRGGPAPSPGASDAAAGSLFAAFPFRWLAMLHCMPRRDALSLTFAESEPFRGPQQAARRASVTCRSADTHGTIADFELLDGQPAAEHDFVALCKAGCAIDEYITYEYLAHPPAAVGAVMLARDEYTEPGSYVLRYTCGGDYSVAGESAPFQVLEEGCSTFRSMDYAEIKIVILLAFRV